MRVAEGPQRQPNRTRNVGGPSKNNGDGYTLTYFLNSVSIAACAIASSISDFAPLAAIPPRIRPSAIIGSPPWFGKKFGKASASTLPFFTVSAASLDGLLYIAACRAFFCANSRV